MPTRGELTSSSARERGMADSLSGELGGRELRGLWLPMARRCGRSTVPASGYYVGRENSTVLEPLPFQ